MTRGTEKTSKQGTSTELLSEELLTKICKQQSEAIFNKFEEKFAKLENCLSSFEAKFEENLKKIEILEKRIDDNEQYNRLNNLRVYGIKETGEENVENLIIELFKNKLNVNISGMDIERVHRLGPLSQGKSRPIIIKFVSFKVRAEIYGQKKLLKKTGFVVREDLTAARLKLVKEAVTKFGVTNVWTLGGKIFVFYRNKKYLIQNTADLEI